MSLLYPRNHEEADTRVFLHVKGLPQQVFQKIAVRTVDANFPVLAASLYHDVQDKVNKLWVDFGLSKDRWFLSSS